MAAIKPIGSATGGLSLLQTVRIYPVVRQPEGGWARSTDEDADPYVVVGIPVGEMVLNLITNWSSPFENAGLESVAGSTTSLLQTGELGELLKAFGVGDGLLNNVDGRSSMTRLNSTQVFAGQPPVDLPLTLRFRAIKDPHQEVEQPIKTLIKWSLSQTIGDSLITDAVSDIKSGGAGVETILPTVIPLTVCIEYGQRVFSPMIIESVAEPINTKMNAKGRRTECEISIKLQSLFAWDRDYYNETYNLYRD